MHIQLFLMDCYKHCELVEELRREKVRKLVNKLVARWSVLASFLAMGQKDSASRQQHSSDNVLCNVL